MSKRSLFRIILDWLNEEDQPKTRITVKNSGTAVANGKGSYSNTGVTLRSCSGSVTMTGRNITIRRQSGPVEINGRIYRKGDPLPEGVDITWA
jgi:hypothetical protein